ncbi:battenin [Melospiza melodia melodia]|uniref:battenin n=1 Tax=Melospiza melodia melodia TaxID=1914991 RepID=UPI002FD1E37A
MELLYFPSSPLPHSAQYRTLQLLYQAGVFLSRSSLRCLRLRRLWGLALAQVLLASFLLAAVAVNHLLPGLGVAAALALGEGLVGAGPTGTPSATWESRCPSPGGRWPSLWSLWGPRWPSPRPERPEWGRTRRSAAGSDHGVTTE